MHTGDYHVIKNVLCKKNRWKASWKSFSCLCRSTVFSACLFYLFVVLPSLVLVLLVRVAFVLSLLLYHIGFLSYQHCTTAAITVELDVEEM